MAVFYFFYVFTVVFLAFLPPPALAVLLLLAQSPSPDIPYSANQNKQTHIIHGWLGSMRRLQNTKDSLDILIPKPCRVGV